MRRASSTQLAQVFHAMQILPTASRRRSRTFPEPLRRDRSDQIQQSAGVLMPLPAPERDLIGGRQPENW